MECIQITIKPSSAFVTNLKGDTLFGQLCWALRNRYGDEMLNEVLSGYQNNEPFAVVSDAYPQGVVARPTVPANLLGFDLTNPAERKVQKQKKWLPIDRLQTPINMLHKYLLSDLDLTSLLKIDKALIKTSSRAHNSINRQTGSTGNGDGFSPYRQDLIWFNPKLSLDLYILFDDQKISQEQVITAIRDIGNSGYGKEASNGLGKYMVEQSQPWAWPDNERANSFLTLAPVAPQGLNWEKDDSFYQPFVRFGRHGAQAAISGKPFKNPVFLAQTAAVLKPHSYEHKLYCGQGLTQLSKTLPKTVHQGYSPVVAVQQ